MLKHKIRNASKGNQEYRSGTKTETCILVFYDGREGREYRNGEVRSKSAILGGLAVRGTLMSEEKNEGD